MSPNSSSPFAFSSMSVVENESENAPTDLIMEQMAAGAFSALCEHLRHLSDRVQNIELMTVGGFCRNCLAKWMVIEARKLSEDLRVDRVLASVFAGSEEACILTVNTLDSYWYEEAAKEVYGCTYPEWKERHQKMATEEQVRRYEESSRLHATHESNLLERKSAGVSVQLSERVMIRLRAGAFLSLCHHLRNRSDEVQNIELMTIGGFCRNCLAKWLVLQARKISDRIGADDVAVTYFFDQRKRTIESLDSFGYDEAAQYVYGCTYPEWKKLYQKKATDDQMERYRRSKGIHAMHDDDWLATRATRSSKEGAYPAQHIPSKAQVCMKEAARPSSLLSDVCCQDVESLVATTTGVTQSIDFSHRMPSPPKGDLVLKIGILTVSDRAFANAYETGDLSGPAVESTVIAIIKQMSTAFQDQNISISHIEKTIVPDEIPKIAEVLMRWSGKTTNSDRSSKEPCDLVFTTGGTGFAPRDVTPEATNLVLDRQCFGLMSWAGMELTLKQPLATLSRASAGTSRDTLIINLPGNPAGAAQVVELLLPLLLHAVKDLRSVVDGVNTS